MRLKNLFNLFLQRDSENLISPEPLELHDFPHGQTTPTPNFEEITFTLEHDEVSDHSEDNDNSNDFPHTEKLVDDWEIANMSVYGTDLTENLPLRSATEDWSSQTGPTENTNFFSAAYAKHKAGFRFALITGALYVSLSSLRY